MIIPINSKNNIILFKHMNQAIVDNYKRMGVIPSMGQHKTTFETTHGVKITVTNSNWSHIEFPSEQDYLLAVLKWL